MGRPIKNTDKLLEKYEDRIFSIYHKKMYWEVHCWHAGPKVVVRGRTLPLALQKLDREVRMGYVG